MIEFLCGFGIGCCLTILFCQWAIISIEKEEFKNDNIDSPGFITKLIGAFKNRKA